VPAEFFCPDCKFDRVSDGLAELGVGRLEPDWPVSGDRPVSAPLLLPLFIYAELFESPGPPYVVLFNGLADSSLVAV
jgi:hypothetical protein